MSKRERGEPQSGLKWLIAALASLGVIATFNHLMLGELHGRFFDPVYPAKNYLYWLSLPLFIKAAYLGIVNMIPPDGSK